MEERGREGFRQTGIRAEGFPRCPLLCCFERAFLSQGTTGDCGNVSFSSLADLQGFQRRKSGIVRAMPQADGNRHVALPCKGAESWSGVFRECRRFLSFRTSSVPDVDSALGVPVGCYNLCHTQVSLPVQVNAVEGKVSRTEVRAEIHEGDTVHSALEEKRVCELGIA